MQKIKIFVTFLKQLYFNFYQETKRKKHDHNNNPKVMAESQKLEVLEENEDDTPSKPHKSNISALTKIKRMIQQSFSIEDDPKPSRRKSKSKPKSTPKPRERRSSSLSSQGSENLAFVENEGMDKEYPHLSAREGFLLKHGINFYKTSSYDVAMKYFRDGLRMSPCLKEFQYGLYLCQQMINQNTGKIYLP
jgi:hypothetical protein